MLLGQTIPKSLWSALDEVPVTPEIDGSVVGKATTATMLDGPFGAVRFLLKNLGNREIRPNSGWWVSSGAITGVHEVMSGAVETAAFDGLGSVSTRIA